MVMLLFFHASSDGISEGHFAR